MNKNNQQELESSQMLNIYNETGNIHLNNVAMLMKLIICRMYIKIMQSYNNNYESIEIIVIMTKMMLQYWKMNINWNHSKNIRDLWYNRMLNKSNTIHIENKILNGIAKLEIIK